ncbi:MAG: HAD-IC family P-type ATPase, partial [Candidatus Bathyarchaeia archaeon]
MANDLWHAIETTEAMRILGTDSQGLKMDEAKKRLEKYGPNELQEAQRVSPLKIFFEQFKEILIIILLAATVISALIGEIVDAIVIVAIVIVCAALGFIQEYRAERSLELLKRMAAPTAIVIREGREMTIPAREVVPGDIIQVKTGDKVPADARVLESFNLRVNEAPLTGESVPVGKKVVTLPSDTPLTERLNILASGTVVTYGRGKGVVVRTGMNTEFGKIAGMLQTVKEETTPLESRMQSVGSWLIKALFAIVGVIVIIGLFRGHELIEMFLWGVSLAVAAVPEALPAIVTGALAIGVYRMAKKNAIVRRLPAVETLGSSTVICSDKTGTLTKGEMTVRRIYLNEQFIEVTGVGYEPVGEFHLSPSSSMEEIQFITRIAALCSDARLEKGTNWQIIGDPTEGALVVAAA